MGVIPDDLKKMCNDYRLMGEQNFKIKVALWLNTKLINNPLTDADIATNSLIAETLMFIQGE